MSTVSVVFLQVCPQCGGKLDEVPGFSGNCPFCGHLIGHDASTCPCQTCQDYRDAQMGLALLDQMKRKKAKRIADGVGDTLPESPAKATVVIGGVVVTADAGGGKAGVCRRCRSVVSQKSDYCPECGEAQTKSVKSCPYCGEDVSPAVKFCPRCGVKQNDATIVCEKCRTEVSLGANFCWHCGRVVPKGKQTADNRKQCPQCGEMVEKERPFCQNCGHANRK